MRLVHGGRGEVAVVGGDQRDAGGIRQRDQPRLDGALAGQAVAVQFHRDAVGERLGQAGQQALGLRLLPLGEQPRERAAGAAGQQDQARCVLRR